MRYQLRYVRVSRLGRERGATIAEPAAPAQPDP